MVHRLRALRHKLHLACPATSRTLSSIQVLIAFTLLAAVAAMAIASVRQAWIDDARKLVSRGDAVASFTARSAARSLEQPSPEAADADLNKALYNIRTEDGLEFAYVIDRSGRVIARSGPASDSGTLAATSLEDAQIHNTGADDGSCYIVRPGPTVIYEFVRPLVLGAAARRQYAAGLDLHVGFALPGFWSFTSASLRSIVPGLAIAFLLLVLGNYLVGLIVRPLRTLKDETAAAAQAQPDAPALKCELDVAASGEIADIARNWNDMVRNFRTSYQLVADARRELEVRNRVMLYEKRRSEAIIDTLSDAVIVTDAAGNICFVNRECENLLALPRDAAVGHAPQEVILDENVQRFLTEALGGAEHQAAESPLAPARCTQKRVADLQLPGKGGVRHLRITCLPVLTSGTQPAGAVTILRDATQEKLEETARKEFVSSVTHELRAPLTAIKSYVEMLIDDEAKDPKLQREFFNTINEEADRLARLINDMLSMSKIEIGNLTLNKSVVRTGKLVEDAVNALRSAAKSKNIELAADIPANLPDIEADKELVRVVVTNLLGNGIKYTQEGGKVFLSAAILSDGAEGTSTIAITVADNGPGIPEDELEKVFEKFYRGRDTAGTSTPGNGLGLAIAREIAALHGGDIHVRSTVGEGSRFTFLLPVGDSTRRVS